MVFLFKLLTPTILKLYKPPLFRISNHRCITTIRENISTFQLKKRTVRKKRTTADEEEARASGLYNVVAFATAEEYDLEALTHALKKQQLYEPNKIENNPDVVHAIAKYQVEEEAREIFFFREGSVVLWNTSDLENSNVLNFLKQYEQDGYSDVLVQNECEFMKYKRQMEEG